MHERRRNPLLFDWVRGVWMIVLILLASPCHPVSPSVSPCVSPTVSCLSTRTNCENVFLRQFTTSPSSYSALSTHYYSVLIKSREVSWWSDLSWWTRGGARHSRQLLFRALLSPHSSCLLLAHCTEAFPDFQCQIKQKCLQSRFYLIHMLDLDISVHQVPKVLHLAGPRSCLIVSSVCSQPAVSAALNEQVAQFHLHHNLICKLISQYHPLVKWTDTTHSFKTAELQQFK